METDVKTLHAGSASVAGRPWRPARGDRAAAILATAAGGLALVLALRVLYLIRFGQDPCWMNFNFLRDAKAMRFGYPAEMVGMPLVSSLLLALRDLGASAAVAIGTLYVAAHLLLAAGVFGLARTVLEDRVRSRVALAIAVAVLPALSTDAGYRNLSCTLAAGSFAALAALLVTPGVRPGPARLAASFLLAALTTSSRPEAALSVAALAAVLALARRRLGWGSTGAAVAAAGFAAGVLGVAAWGHLAPDRGLSANVWAFYTFYEANPLLVRLALFLRDPGSVATEYARYRQTARWFGSFEENGGSILRALFRHPGTAAVWLLAKPFDLVATILAPDSFTPLALVPFFLAVRRLRREGRGAARRWGPVACAFAAPLAFLLVWSQGYAPYLLIVSPLLVLAAVWGLEPALAAATGRRLRAAAVVVLLAGAAVVAFAGHGTPSTAPALAAAARWLQGRCAAGGCLVNALPQPIDAQVWADLQAGARFPPRENRSEAFVLHRYPPAFVERVRFERRIEDALRGGWRGPILYVRVTARSLKAFDDDFDPEHRLEGVPDLSRAERVATFRRGPDTVEVFELARGAP